VAKQEKLIQPQSTDSKTYKLCSDFVPSCYFTNTEVMKTHFELTLN